MKNAPFLIIVALAFCTLICCNNQGSSPQEAPKEDRSTNPNSNFPDNLNKREKKKESSKPSKSQFKKEKDTLEVFKPKSA